MGDGNGLPCKTWQIMAINCQKGEGFNPPLPFHYLYIAIFAVPTGGNYTPACSFSIASETNDLLPFIFYDERLLSTYIVVLTIR